MRVVTLGGLGANAPFVSAPGAMLNGFGSASTPYGTNPISVAQADEANSVSPSEPMPMLLPVAALQSTERRGYNRGFWIGLGVGVLGGALAMHLSMRK